MYNDNHSFIKNHPILAAILGCALITASAFSGIVTANYFIHGNISYGVLFSLPTFLSAGSGAVLFGEIAESIQEQRARERQIHILQYEEEEVEVSVDVEIGMENEVTEATQPTTPRSATSATAEQVVGINNAHEVQR